MSMQTILLIDDNEVYRSALVEILQFENYMALEAPDGSIGLNTIRQHMPDLIFCDLDMPVMNGVELLKTIKADPKCARIPFVISTGRNDEIMIRTALELGASSFLPKPINITRFLALIRQLLQDGKALFN